MKSVVHPHSLPTTGPLTVGTVYRRADLHSRFGGNHTTGIVPSKREPVVLLFHTEEPLQQFYRDGFDPNGVYWYSGEGAAGPGARKFGQFFKASSIGIEVPKRFRVAFSRFAERIHHIGPPNAATAHGTVRRSTFVGPISAVLAAPQTGSSYLLFSRHSDRKLGRGNAIRSSYVRDLSLKWPNEYQKDLNAPVNAVSNFGYRLGWM